MIDPNLPNQPSLCAIPHPGHPLIAKKLWKVPVVIRVNDSRLCATIKQKTLWLIAKSAADAANWVRDQLDFLPETEIEAYGPKGGRAYRFIGWSTAIGTGIFAPLSEEEIAERLDLIFGDD
jgi:hypothetical protein